MKVHIKWVCRICNTSNSMKRSFCIRCGAERPEQKICKKCGAVLTADQRFCFDCGTPVESNIGSDSLAQMPRNEKITKDEFVTNCSGNHQNSHNTSSRYCIKCGKPVNGEVFLCEQCAEKKRRTASLWMRSVAAVLALALLSGIAVHFVGNRTPKVNNAEQAISVLKDMGKELGYENAFSELTEKNITTIDGDSYYRLQQNYRGVPVYGKTVVYSADDTGKTRTITSNVADIKTPINLAVTITKDQIVKSIQSSSDEFALSENDIRELLSDLNSDDLCIYVAEDGTEHLAYVIDAGWVEYVVDAKEGNLLHSREIIQALTGYMASDLNRTKGFPIEQEDDGSYCLADLENEWYIWNLQGKSSKGGKDFSDSDKVMLISEDIIFGNDDGEEQYETGAQLFLNVRELYNYYNEFFAFELDRMQIFYNDGSMFQASIAPGHCAFGGSRITTNSEKIGTISMGTVTGVQDYDILGHEFGHVVSRMLVDWKSNSVENKAINEGLSDIWGEITEVCVFNNSLTPDWVVRGDNVSVKRNLCNPEDSTNAAHVDDKQPILDMVDEHYFYSTIISHSAYLMWNGIDGNAAKGIDIDALAKLWYRAMLMMPSDCNFVECRTLVELAASTMNLTDMQKQCVCEAFDAVGIPRASEEEYSELVHLVTDGETAIKGTVYEVKTVDGVETVIPVSKATVTVYDENSSKVYKKLNMKNKDGFFEIELPAGIYSVAISADGYIGQTITFKLDDNEVRYFSIAMEPAVEEPAAVPTETSPKDDALSGKCGDNLTWTLENGVLTISGTGAMYDYDIWADVPWNPYAETITSVKIGEGVKNIGTYAFSWLPGITSVTIPGNINDIGDHAFAFSSNLKNVTIKNGVKTIGISAFHECYQITSIKLPDSITRIGDSTFWNCYLTSITMSKNLSSIGSHVFETVDNNELKEIYFTGNAPSFADDAFYGVRAKAYCPDNNSTWTSSVMKDYGGHIDWVKEHEPVILGSFKNLSEAYIYAINSKPNGRFSYGMLEDIDSDGTDELVLGYCDSINVDGTDWTAHCYSIYDYKNKNLICCVDNEVICYEVAGSSGRIGVVNYKNKPTLMLKKWKAPNGTTGDLFENYYTLLDANKYQPFRELRVDQHNDRNIWYEYYVDNSEVTQAGFEDELKNYKYLTLNSKGTVDYSYPEKSFDELKEYLESLEAPQTGMELAAYKPILEKVMKSSGYNTYNEYTRSYCEGILIDLDGDGVQELVLKHLSSNEPNFGTEYLLSVYDYENGKVITRLNGISFGEFGGAGESAAVTILYNSGKPYIMTYNEFGETSPSGTMKPSITGIAKIYDGKTCKEIDSYWIDRYRNAMSYEIDGKSVAENVFINSIEAYDGVEVVCEMYQLIDIPQKLLTASKLLNQLK